VNVSEAMATQLCTADSGSTVADAATLMGEHAVGSVLITEGDRVAGILTERDIVRALSTAHDAPTRPVTEWMTADPVTIEPGADLKVALKTMIDGGFRHLPVVENGRPVGMLSIRDVAGRMAE
jgi:CBS domain-containing protein